MIYALVIAACAVINRLAGGGWPVTVVQGTPWRFLFGRVQCAAAIGLVALTLHAWPVALAFGAGFVFWRLFGWGHLISLGRPSGASLRKPTGVDKLLVESIGPHWGLFARMLFVLPMLIAVAYLTGNPATPLLAVPFAALAVGAYEIWWRIKPDPIGPSEISVGVLWGAMIVTTARLP
jgi:hypothetical protein